VDVVVAEVADSVVVVVVVTVAVTVLAVAALHRVAQVATHQGRLDVKPKH
jgi:hypothetical protein